MPRKISKGCGRPKDAAKAKAILNAAGYQFITHGMSGVTMQDIADQAGVSKYTVYNHFGTKAALFKKIIASKCELHMSQQVL